MVTLSGLVSDNRDQDVRGQTRDILAKIDELLAEYGTDKSRIVSAMIWLRQIMDFDSNELGSKGTVASAGACLH